MSGIALVLEALLCALRFSSTAFLTINDGNTTPIISTPFLTFHPNHAALAKHGASSDSSSQWLLLSVCDKRNTQKWLNEAEEWVVVEQCHCFV